MATTDGNPDRKRTIIGRRVKAWTGSRNRQQGTVVRVDGLYRQIVRWDSDHAEEPYRTADLIATN